MELFILKQGRHGVLDMGKVSGYHASHTILHLIKLEELLMVIQTLEIQAMKRPATNVRNICMAVLFAWLSCDLYAFGLDKGSLPMDNPPATRDAYEFYYLSTGFPEDGIAFFEYDKDNSLYYSLGRKNVIVNAKVFRDSLDNFIFQYDILNKWPLTLWSYEPVELEVLERYEHVRRDFSTLHPSPSHPLGCLKSTPLRYGDIDGDGVNELVIFIGNQLLVFSPSAQKTVFGMNMRVDDWMTEEETQSHFEYYPPAGIDEITPYYQSAANMDYASELPGYRGYGKLYSSDFDKNGSPDILVWRKLYLSRMLNVDKGFDKISDTYYHYEKSATGEYVLKDTAPKTIQSWLAEKNLTWQSGYPSQSECEGEEGQLIPEMHDPLLNDPDVLH
jgi:hypothetical protein